LENNLDVFETDDFMFIGDEINRNNQVAGKNLSYWADARRRLLKNKVAMISLVSILLIVVLAIIIPLNSPYTYEKQSLTNINALPNSEHLFGTDSLGRDLWVRAWYGARVSLAVGVFGSIVPSIIGIIIGGISGYFGGKIDMAIMRAIDIIMCVPAMIYIILIMLYIGSGPIPLIIAFALTGWMGTARNVRGMVLQLKEREFVLASKALGASSTSLIFSHLIPNTLGIVIVSVTMGVPAAIFHEAYLSFIGLGIAPPIPSWGQLANLGIAVFRIYPYQLLIPSIMISITMLSFNLFGDGLRDALDPKLRN